MLWEQAQLGTIETALDRARSAHPTTLTILGDPGMGKSSLLRELVNRADDFEVAIANGDETGYGEPFTVLNQLGVANLPMVGQEVLSPLVAAQNLRERVDALSAKGPVLIVVDDMQRADRESIEALFWLAQRARGDRLLIAVSVRAGEVDATGVWSRLLGHDDSITLSLGGLSLEQARALILEHDTSATASAIAHVWERTEGNPFYIRTLLQRYPANDLAEMREVPAPVEMATRVQEQLHDVDPDALSILQAAAVVGHSWTGMPALAAIAGVADPAHAVDVLVKQDLLVWRSPDPGAPLRTPHALVRSSVYQAMPLARRRELHLRAAEHLAHPMAALEHRAAAATAFDDDLAAELDAAGGAAHANGDYRDAHHLYRWASRVTSSPALRRRRMLDSLFESVQAGDIARAQHGLDVFEHFGQTDQPREALVRAGILNAEKRWSDALAILATVPQDALDATDDKTRYRLLVLEAWCAMSSGGSTADIAPLVEKAEEVRYRDPSFYGNHVFAAGLTGLRLGHDEEMVQAFEGLPENPALTPLPLTFRLAWRGTIASTLGLGLEAEADLAEVSSRIGRGLADFGDGLFNAHLSGVRWMTGQWHLAEADMRLAIETSIGPTHPTILSLSPLVPSVRGDFARADELLQTVEKQLIAMPWREVAWRFATSRTVRLHAGADPAAQKQAINHLRDAFGDDVTAIEGIPSHFWMLHLALSAVWAGELDLAEDALASTLRGPRIPGWTRWTTPWLSGLITEAAGDAEDARALLGVAEARRPHRSRELPLYQAHVLVDLARVMTAQGEKAEAARMRETASNEYGRLGATPYVQRLNAISEAPASTVTDDAVLDRFSDRERDVIALVVNGLSYAQIARTLYVTRSTVGFHLSNIYAKAGVTSRHGLSEFMRGTSAAHQMELSRAS